MNADRSIRRLLEHSRQKTTDGLEQRESRSSLCIFLGMKDLWLALQSWPIQLYRVYQMLSKTILIDNSAISKSSTSLWGYW